MKVSGPVGHFLLEVLDDRFEELFGGHPALVGTDKQREVLGHLAALDGLDAYPLERFGELDDIGCVVEPAAIDQAAGPGEDAGGRVGRRRLALLVLRDRRVCGRVLCGVQLGAAARPGFYLNYCG